jgi:cell division transport system ATP-binding protein
MIRVNHLTKSYNGNPVLKDLNLSIQPGEFVFLQGASGSGKSTLLKLLYRDIEHFEGEIFIQDQPLKQIPKYLARRLMGTIFQSFELLDRKTALENVALAGEVVGRNQKDISADAYSLLDKVGLKGKEDRYPHQLSGGEQQRVAIARALLNRPSILLADEPTGNLDPQNAMIIMELLFNICKKEKITMLVVTHSQELIQQFSARILFMEDGQVRDHGHTSILST